MKAPEGKLLFLAPGWDFESLVHDQQSAANG